MKYQQLSGATPTNYYKIPRELDTFIADPKQEIIMMYLSRIPPKLFPEFVKDILVIIEHHVLIDLTDGPGDEKQDILTMSSNGTKYIIQCKHSMSLKNKSNGDELDLLLAACIRKNCRASIFVTNGDITPQAKKYITDREYLRGWPHTADSLFIDYWNHQKIWQRIKSNNIILNKWFSGLGQTHGLRSFRFDFSICQLPFVPAENANLMEDIFSLLAGLNEMIQTDKEFQYEGRLNDQITFLLSPGIHLINNIDINYTAPEDEDIIVRKLLESLCIEVRVDSNWSFDPNDIRRQVITYLLEKHLPSLQNGNWWHIVVGRSTSFIFIHDITEPKLVVLDSAETFVKAAGKKIVPELAYCTLNPDEFIYSEQNYDRGFFHHVKTKSKLIQYFTQKTTLLDGFNAESIQEKQRLFLSNYVFKMIGGLNLYETRKIINMLPQEWFSFQFDKTTIIFCYINNEEDSIIQITEEKIKDSGFQIFTIPENKKNKIIEDINMIRPDFMTHDRLHQLSFPIDLKARMFWIAKAFDFGEKCNLDVIWNLAKYKLSYEDSFGFRDQLLKGKVSYHDLTIMLLDLNSIRGPRMLDINIWNNPIWIVMRFKEGKIQSSNELANEAIKEFEQVYEDIQTIVTTQGISK